MKNELVCLWLDDIRPAPDGYIHAHSVNEAKRVIQEAEERGVMKFTLDLDHDLGDYAADGGDGIELVKWLAETKRYYEVILHTMNPVGRQNMQAIIDRYWQKWLDELDETDTQVILKHSQKYYDMVRKRKEC